MVGALGRLPGAVQDDEHREVAQRQQLAEHEEVVADASCGLDAGHDLQQLVGDEDRKKECGEEASEDQVSPVGAISDPLFDLGCDHLRWAIYQPGDQDSADLRYRIAFPGSPG